MKYLFTSESVTEGHPDKVCDRISDAVLDALLAQDENARCACETVAQANMVHMMGEVTTQATVDYVRIARECIAQIGYTKPEYGFNAQDCAITCSLHEQSPDIAQGVNSALEAREGAAPDIGAGDQGMMFGFACDETPALMPLPVMLAHTLSERLATVRKAGLLPFLRPDGKTQVTVEYDGHQPVRVDTIVVSAQHDPDVSIEALREGVVAQVIQAALPENWMDDRTRILVNPTGRFVLGGPAADTGLTGRKIIVDTYGGYSRHGGGAFSGKDPTKVDRSAAYMARNIAKTIVTAGAARRCEVQLAYAIGVARPVSLMADTFGTGAIPEEQLCAWIERCFDLRPAAIIDKLELRKPVYAANCNYGHMGKAGMAWERIDQAALSDLRGLL